MKQRGFNQVRHLKGGILRYLEEVGSAGESTFEGECYVFGKRTFPVDTPSKLSDYP